MERADDVLIGGGSSTSSGMLNGSSVGVGGGSENINAVMSSMSSSNTTTTNLTSSGVGTSSSTAGNISSSSYTMPGILHYLQHEWNRFEYERQQWEIDRAELMSKISFLQGERRGQENLKNNLIRRIKMLELALKQERVKYHKLMYGVEPNTNELKSNTSNTNLSNENNDGNNDIENGTFSIGQHPILNKENAANSSASIKQGRQLLKQYLQEIGYADTIIDIRSARLRGLLGLKNAAAAAAAAAQGGYDEQAAQSNEHLTNGCGRGANRVGGPNSATSFTVAAVAAAAGYANQLNGCLNASDLQKMLKLTEGSADPKSLDFLNNQIAAAAAAAAATNGDNRNSRSGYDDEEEATEEDEMLRQRQQRATNKNGSGDTTSSSCEFQAPGGVDSDTEDALKEFAFLSNEISSPSSSSSSSSSSASSSSSEIDGAAGAGGVGTDWNVDREKIARLTELYKKDRKSSKTAKQQQQQQQTSSLGSHTVQRPNRAELKAMIANLTETAQSGAGQGGDSSPADIESPGSAAGENKAKSDQQQQQQQINSMTSFSNNAKLFLEDDAFANDANLGELSRISVNNSVNLSGLNDETVIDSQRKTIYNKYTLRGHLDGVRCVAFHPTESVLLSGSEDQTIKLWNLDKISQNNKKSGTTDVEPIYTFRKHTGPVLSLVMSANGDYCISSGLDANIIIWNMPSYETDQYDIYSPNVYVKNLNGHTDAVWNMVLIDNTLVSVSADSTIRVWNPFSIDDLNEASSTSISCLNENKSEGVATSVDFINGEKSRIVASFGSTHHNMYDIETSKLISKFDYYDSKINTHCYKVISHPATASPSSSSLIVSAHEDKKIRFFDINSGKMVYHMVAHQDACTDLAIDPSCFYLLSSSHDCSIRLWNLENKNCIQEMTCHRKKYDESINCVSFHPTKPFIASGGADAVVKIYV